MYHTPLSSPLFKRRCPFVDRLLDPQPQSAEGERRSIRRQTQNRMQCNTTATSHCKKLNTGQQANRQTNRQANRQTGQPAHKQSYLTCARVEAGAAVVEVQDGRVTTVCGFGSWVGGQDAWVGGGRMGDKRGQKDR